MGEDTDNHIVKNTLFPPLPRLTKFKRGPYTIYSVNHLKIKGSEGKYASDVHAGYSTRKSAYTYFFIPIDLMFIYTIIL
jgi:hypothetical protein